MNIVTSCLLVADSSLREIKKKALLIQIKRGLISSLNDNRKLVVDLCVTKSFIVSYNERVNNLNTEIRNGWGTIMERQTLIRTLTLSQVVFLGIAWNNPMVFFNTYGIATVTSQGVIMGAYVIAFLAILFTAFSYGKDGKSISNRWFGLYIYTKVY